MVNSCVKCCFGVGYGVCCIVIGVWGILFMGILAALMLTGKKGNIGIETSGAEEDKKYGMTLIYTVIIYLVLTIGCSINVWYRLKHPWAEEHEASTVKQFSAIGPSNSDQKYEKFE